MVADSRRMHRRPAAMSRAGARHGAFRRSRTDSRRYHRAGMGLRPYDFPALERCARAALAEERACADDDDVARASGTA
jgi:hypothetical protein